MGERPSSQNVAQALVVTEVNLSPATSFYLASDRGSFQGDPHRLECCGFHAPHIYGTPPRSGPFPAHPSLKQNNSVSLHRVWHSKPPNSREGCSSPSCLKPTRSPVGISKPTLAHSGRSLLLPTPLVEPHLIIDLLLFCRSLKSWSRWHGEPSVLLPLSFQRILGFNHQLRAC